MSKVSKIEKYEFVVEYKDKNFKAIFERARVGEEYESCKIIFPAEMSEKDREAIKDYLSFFLNLK